MSAIQQPQYQRLDDTGTVPGNAPEASRSIPLFKAIAASAQTFGEQVASRKSLLGRVAVGATLGIGTLVTTIVAIASALMALLVQAILVLPGFWPTTRRHESFGANLRAILQESQAVGLAIGTALIQPVKKQIQPSNEPLVIFVHGYAHSGAAWNYYQKQLKARGIETMALDWGGPLQSLEKATQTVTDKLNALGIGDRKVIAVGHSTGGVIAQRLLDAGTVHGIVSLGGPLGGTPLAPLAPGKCMKQMRLKSQTLQEVNESLRRNSAPRYLVRATADLLVPPGSATLKDEPSVGRLKRERGSNGGHLSLLYSPRILDIIQEQTQSLPQQEAASGVSC
jgi:pimeloyl-ACP methyl ester carboxylesterase